MKMINKIYCFCNGNNPFGVSIIALSDTGKVLTGHACSHIGFAKHDIGITSNWKHEIYNKEFPNGWELEWIDEEDIEKHKGFLSAKKLHNETGEINKEEMPSASVTLKNDDTGKETTIKTKLYGELHENNE